jgi:hypothetical protein
MNYVVMEDSRVGLSDRVEFADERFIPLFLISVTCCRPAQ